MFAVFDESIAKSPEGLQIPVKESVSNLKDGLLAQHFSSIHPGSVTINHGSSCVMAIDTDKQNPFLPRYFAVVDNIHCLFQGHIENIALLKKQYGLSKTGNEVTVVIEAYRTLRDRGPYPADKVLRDLGGKFAFILYDGSSKASFIATDALGSVPFFWGTDSVGHVVFSDDEETVMKSCGKSAAPFPKGCFFTTSGGLKSYEHPTNVLKAMPRVDSSGQLCGVTFKVDKETRRVSSMPRVGSSANWSALY